MAEVAVAEEFSLALGDMSPGTRAMALEDFLLSQTDARVRSLLNKPELLGVELEAWCAGSRDATEFARFLGPLAVRRLTLLVEETVGDLQPTFG